MVNNLEEINKLKKSRNIWLIVAAVAAFGTLMRWFGVYGAGPGSISWLTIGMYIVAMVIAFKQHIKLSNITE